MRAVSTVLDASLCLLLVTASALTLVGTPFDGEPGSGANSELNPDTADEAAEMLTTTTARVTYDVGDQNRTAHDTLAGLIAAAALADADGSSTTSFRRAVTETVSHELRQFDVDVQVVADPILDRETALGGRVVAGHAPAPTADVHAARVEVRGVRLIVRTWSR